ncbi:hypothetical protein [Streptomyces agglomeratus]|nr:hypothetical protein [Streptomyces agglomeratus]
MSEEISDREWKAFMNKAFGLSISESGLLIDVDSKQDATPWAS